MNDDGLKSQLAGISRNAHEWLNLVKDCAQLHNGNARGKSHMGEGSVFTVSFPADLKPSIHPDTAGNRTNKNKRLKLLVVDDHATLSKSGECHPFFYR